MAKKTLALKPKIALYILITLGLSLALTIGIFAFSKMSLPLPPAASITSNTPSLKLTTLPTEDYKIKVQNELDKIATVSARIKSANSWLTIELPKIDFAVQL